MTEKVYIRENAEMLDIQHVERILKCTAACNGEQLHFQMPILLEKCKCKEFWKVLLLKLSEETISRNPVKGVSEVLWSLWLKYQSYKSK